MAAEVGAVPQPTTPPDDGNASPPEKRPRVEPRPLDVDAFIAKMLAVKGKSPDRQSVFVQRDEVVNLCDHTYKVLMDQENLLELEAPMNLCGDIHGQYHDLLRLFDTAGYPQHKNYLFLGDYVDRGKRSLETVFLLFAYKIKYPERFFLLRGNHESPSICRIYGFYDEVKQRYNVALWKRFIDVFNVLPACAVIDDRVICMHGGLSPAMAEKGQNVRQMVLDIPRPAHIPDAGFLCDLLWSDPNPDISGFGNNDRGVSVSFGADVVKNFLQNENMDLVVRAHQVIEDGYEFFAGRSLVTIFSAPNYCGEFDNAGAVLCIDDSLECTFKILRPETGMNM